MLFKKLVRKDMDVNESERQCDITLKTQIKEPYVETQMVYQMCNILHKC
jgi:hypothetical protein